MRSIKSLLILFTVSVLGPLVLIGCKGDPRIKAWKEIGSVGSVPTQGPSSPLDFLLIRSQGDTGETMDVQIEAIRTLALSDDPRVNHALDRAGHSTEDGGFFSSDSFSWCFSDGRKARVQAEVARALTQRLVAHKA